MHSKTAVASGAILRLKCSFWKVSWRKILFIKVLLKLTLINFFCWSFGENCGMPQFTSRLKKGTWKIKLFFLVKLNGDKWNCFNSFSCLFRLLKSFWIVARYNKCFVWLCGFADSLFTCSECHAGSLPSLPGAFCSSSVHSIVRLRRRWIFG